MVVIVVDKMVKMVMDGLNYSALYGTPFFLDNAGQIDRRWRWRWRWVRTTNASTRIHTLMDV